jgi:toxin secretion/phage lysis holin
MNRKGDIMNLSNFSYSHIYWIFLLPLIGAGADIVTGWIQATINNNWKSDIMRAGLYRKSGELLIVVLGFVAEQAVPVIGQYKLATWISLYICIMEAISVLENLNQAGVAFPKRILKKLGKVKEELDGDDEDDGK